MEIRKNRLAWILLLSAALFLGGCSSTEGEEGEKLSQEISEKDLPASQEQAGAPGEQSLPEDDELWEDIPKGMISDQSFAVALDGWGEVTFASFEPEYYMEVSGKGATRYGDARFMLLKGDKVVYRLPAQYEDNAMYSQQFGQVLAVAFRDYNEDGRMDILTILEYTGVQGSDVGESFQVVRLYTQEDDGKNFIFDERPSEYLCAQHCNENMAAVYGGLKEYSGWYSMCTSKSVWEVERFARKVRRQILEGDYEGLSQEIAYPVTIDGIQYQDREAFLQADFIGNLSKEAYEWLEKEPCANMFINWQGIMMGNGQVWIGEVQSESLTSKELKVTALSGLTAQQ